MDLQCRNTSSSPNQLKKFIPIVSSHRVHSTVHIRSTYFPIDCASLQCKCHSHTACSPAYTDLQQYQNLSEHLYRLTPNLITPKSQKGLHGDDEEITVEQYHKLVDVYLRIITNADNDDDDINVIGNEHPATNV